MLYLLYLVGVLLTPGGFPVGCGQSAHSPAPITTAADNGDFAPLPPGPQLEPGLSPAEPNPEPAAASGGEAPAAGANGTEDTAVSMDPPDDELPEDDIAPVLSSWVANLPDGSTAPENMILRTPLNLVAGDAGNEEQVRLRWSVESANQLAFMIQRQQWWGEQWIDSDLIVAPPFPYSYTDSPGAGLWRYAIAAANTEGISPPSDWSEVRVDSSWTTFTPSADTRIVYVSSSGGNDSNDGLSTLTPKATIAAGYALLRHGYPDWLLLKRGDTWDESLGHWKKSGRSATEMMVVNTYGDAIARPLLRTGTGNGFTRVQGGGSPLQIDNLALVGVHLWAHARTPTSTGVGLSLLDGGDNWIIEDCKIEGYSNNINAQSFRGLFRNIFFHRCIVIDAYRSDAHSQGIYAEGIEGLEIVECIFDHNGHMPSLAAPTIYNHNVYIQSSTINAVLRDNIFTRAASHGAQVRGGGEVSGCLFIRNPIALLVGGGDPITPGGVIVNVRDNVVLEGTDISPELLRGFGIDFKNVASGVIANNVVANKLATNPYAFGIGSWVSGGPPGVGLQNLTIENNVVYNWRGGARFNNQSPATYSNVRFRDNVLYTSINGDTAPLVEASTAFDGISLGGNRYFSAASSTPFRNNGNNLAFSAWVAASGEASSAVQSTSFHDPSRSLEGYCETITGSPHTIESAIGILRSQSRHNWDDRFQVREVRAYVAAGFERTN